jgi:beta-xylosidase
MKRKYIVLTFTFFLAACGSATESPPAQTQPSPTQTISIAPTQTQESTPTATVVPATEPIVDPAAFRDDFEGSLEEGWQWLHEDTSNWSLTEVPGSLQINVIGGEMSDDSIVNLLLRDAPPGDFQIETKVAVRPQANFQFAGLIVYESASNFIQAGRAFCDDPDLCAGEGLYVDHYNGGTWTAPNFATAYTEDEVYLRLTRQGDTYTFETSSDGSEWSLLGEHDSQINPLQIGLVAGQNTAEVIPAVFDYFEVRSVL